MLKCVNTFLFSVIYYRSLLFQIGMVAWKMTFITPEYPQGRDAIVICNDITHLIGTFAPQEDILFLVSTIPSLLFLTVSIN